MPDFLKSFELPVFFRRGWLNLFSCLNRRIHVFPGRILNMAGFDLFTGNLHSDYWGEVGKLVGKVDDGKMLMQLDMKECHQRFSYITGRGHDEHIARWIRSTLTEGSCFIDIGANIGWFTILASRIIGRGEIFAFEPNPINFNILKYNCAINKVENITLINAAVGREDSTSQLSDAFSSSQLSNMRPGGSKGPSLKVEIVMADKILVSLPPNARGACKIDVEGFEFEVLKGMHYFISTHPWIEYCVEVTEPWIKECSGSEASAQLIYNIFTDNGFKAYKLGTTGDLLEIHNIPKEQSDIVFSRRLANSPLIH